MQKEKKVQQFKLYQIVSKSRSELPAVHVVCDSGTDWWHFTPW